MIDTKFLLLVLLIGLTGWSSWWLFFATEEAESSTAERYFFIFIGGFAVTSICLFLLTFVGYFQWKVWAALTSGLFIAYQWKVRRFPIRQQLKLLPYLLGCLLLGLISLGLTKINKPFQAILWGDDASVFIGAASQLARSGSLTYTDPLVLEMTPQERSQILRNRFLDDMTGDLIRFPGGVRLVDASKGKVGFSFYHLLPAWLALGIQTLGYPGFLNLLTLFSILTLLTLYFLGKLLAGPWLGASLVVVMFFFYPQSYFSRMPSPEILSQLLFLAGLMILISGSKNSQMPVRKQYLAGIVWGALFLCRLESMYMLITSLILAFSLIPIFSKNPKQWHPLILSLFLFFLLGIYYQIIRGEYLYFLTSPQFSTNGIIDALGIELLAEASKLTGIHPVWSNFLFAGFCLCVILIVRWACNRNLSALPQWIKTSAGLIAAGILLAPVLTYSVSWTRIGRNVRWISVYFPPRLSYILIAGLVFFIFWLIRQKERKSLLQFVLILFLVPAVCYILNPLVTRDQPWAIRRFVPVVFPLFFILSLGGWLYLLRTLSRSRIFPQTVFSVLVLAISVFLYMKSGYLLTDRLYDDVSSQVEKISNSIPSNTLVVVPDSWAGIHLQTALQYSMGAESLLLPLNTKMNGNLGRTVAAYLSRQIQHRPVIALFPGAKDPPEFLRKAFGLKFYSIELIQFGIVPRIEESNFPDQSQRVSLEFAFYTLHPKKKEVPEKSVLFYDEPDVTFVNFYDKERGFRWTSENSTIENFVFETERKKIFAILSTNPQYSFYKNNDLGLSLVINGNHPMSPLKVENGNYLFDIDGNTIPEITSVTIESKTFIPAKELINSDPRRLGVCFLELRFQRE